MRLNPSIDEWDSGVEAFFISQVKLYNFFPSRSPVLVTFADTLNFVATLLQQEYSNQNNGIWYNSVRIQTDTAESDGNSDRVRTFHVVIFKAGNWSTDL